MPRLYRPIAIALILLVLAIEAAAHDVIIRTRDGRSVSFSQLVEDAVKSDLVLIGEAHDDKSHHEMQLALIRALWEKNIPLAIGMETMEAGSQQQLDAWTEGRMSEENFQMVFADNWSMDWGLYREIFIFARDNRVPMLALNVPKEIVQKVSRQGFASLTPEERKDLPQGTTCDLRNPHTALLRKAFQQNFLHLKNMNTFTYFCEAQTVRNSGMAWNIARYAEKNADRKIVALTGTWHAIKNAIPEQLERNGSKLGYTVIIPEIPELPQGSAAASEADYIISR